MRQLHETTSGTFPLKEVAEEEPRVDWRSVGSGLRRATMEGRETSGFALRSAPDLSESQKGKKPEGE